MVRAATMVVVLMVAIYTASYGLWAWRKGNKRGAIGTFLLAWLTLISPILVWLFQEPS
ncbi:MAG: hypothetical protein U1D96_08610 [Eubacteriales bacterium]|nr:hypothetical protein [Bacillota bacterium]MBV1728097.1 hypothetical protein [Desulforudis sp.]MDP3050036.1 hypothetical protein [Eubacteriales bacterium]MDQ7788629.1 hypothetical protein [Clostridia bacterium]MBU4532535.1 hypothetical protein [Bacillota bacterium]